MRKITSPYIVIKKSRIHSAGIFAKNDISKGTRVIEYVGEKITKAVADRRADIPLEKNKKNGAYGAVYIFILNKRHDIDGNVKYNTARLINHSCDPNCETEIIRGHIWVIAIRDIKKGKEIAYNYNYDVEDYEDHQCCCGSKRCVGYILDEDYWPRLKRKEKIKKEKSKKAKKANKVGKKAKKRMQVA